MKKQFNPTPTPVGELTDEQTIDAIYAMFGAKRTPLQIQPVGRFGIINPGPKEFTGALLKLQRKTRTLEDAKNHLSMADVIDRDYRDQPEALFDLLSDWSRFAIIIPNFATAPMVVEHFLHQFGGKIDFHDSDDYEAIHQHTTYKGVNIEFQFYTKGYAELKKATDIFYHQYNNIVIEPNSYIHDEFTRQQDQLIEYCQNIYQHSDFRKHLFDVQAVVDKYQFSKLNKPIKEVKHNKLRHFCMYARKAELVQNELADYLPKFLEQLNQKEKTL
ncbi:MAG: hypothetical protein NC133_03545 [Prevotella sp.]|nr:hypothetical protein [Prevotella sp.]